MMNQKLFSIYLFVLILFINYTRYEIVFLPNRHIDKVFAGTFVRWLWSVNNNIAGLLLNHLINIPHTSINNTTINASDKNKYDIQNQ